MPQPSNFAAAQAAMTAAAGAGTDRKNLVLIFIPGGSCAHNTIIPRTNPNRTHYTNLRPSLAIADNPATAIDADWCFHPNLGGLKSLWDLGKLAIVRNVGPLVFPITRAQFLARSVQVPPQLYSHADQQNVWETGLGDQPVLDTGWIGRMAELLIPFNAGSTVSPLLSFAGPTDTFRAFDLRTLALGAAGLSTRDGGSRVIGAAQTIVNNLFANEVSPNPLVNEYLETQRRSVAATSTVSAARNAAADPVNIPPGFPGSNMRTALRLASQQALMNHRRSMFFLQTGGADDHSNQLSEQVNRFSALGPLFLEAYNATVNYGVQNSTTFVVYTEFGRSLRQNGSGTDHGWGGHAFVFGGDVVGGWYGNPYSLDPAGPDIVENAGHLIPTTSVDTLIATLGHWMGIPDATANGVNPTNLLVPNLPNFPVRDLALFTP